MSILFSVDSVYICVFATWQRRKVNEIQTLENNFNVTLILVFATDNNNNKNRNFHGMWVNKKEKEKKQILLLLRLYGICFMQILSRTENRNVRVE